MSTSKYLFIDKHFPNADFSSPPLSKESWAEAVNQTLQSIDGGNLAYEDCKIILGYPLDLSLYNSLTSEELAAQKQLAAKDSPSSLPKESFVHANYLPDTQDFQALLIIDGELIAQSKETFPTLASAKKKYQAYLGVFKAGFKTKEQLRELLEVKELKSDSI
jgi:hypothetical protein